MDSACFVDMSHNETYQMDQNILFSPFLKPKIIAVFCESSKVSERTVSLIIQRKRATLLTLS